MNREGLVSLSTTANTEESYLSAKLDQKRRKWYYLNDDIKHIIASSLPFLSFQQEQMPIHVLGATGETM